MKCHLCNKNIENYNSEFNQLEIDDKNKVDICNSCVDKFTKWQQTKLAKLFPTKTLKKMYGENKKSK